MEFIIGATIAGIFIFFWNVKRKIESFDKLCDLDFSTWHRTYISSRMPEKQGIARSFLIQSLHLAGAAGIVKASDMPMIEMGLRKEQPIEVLDGWLNTALGDINAVCGVGAVASSPARTAGAMMLLCVQSINPQGDLRIFLASQ